MPLTYVLAIPLSVVEGNFHGAHRPCPRKFQNRAARLEWQANMRVANSVGSSPKPFFVVSAPHIHIPDANAAVASKNADDDPQKPSS